MKSLIQQPQGNALNYEIDNFINQGLEENKNRNAFFNINGVLTIKTGRNRNFI